MKRTKQEAAETRQRILDAALIIFTRKGFTAATLNDIADEADLTRGAIYWHFSDKAALYTTLIQSLLARSAAALGNAANQPDAPLERLRHRLIWMIEQTEVDSDYRAAMELTLFKTEVSPELAEGMRQKSQNMARLVEDFTSMIREAVETGTARPETNPYAAGLAAVGMVMGLTSLWLLDTHAFSIRQQGKAVVDNFLRGIAL